MSQAVTAFCRCSDVYIKVSYNDQCLVSQVNSKGYKVCGEASSVCGTITINKRKVETSFWCYGFTDKGVTFLIL